MKGNCKNNKKNKFNEICLTFIISGMLRINVHINKLLRECYTLTVMFNIIKFSSSNIKQYRYPSEYHWFFFNISIL